VKGGDYIKERMGKIWDVIGIFYKGEWARMKN
jgi:hypothetical protein